MAFYTLDNATADQFDNAQVSWFERVLARDAADPAIATVVVGMHEALPDSIGASHSMNDSPTARKAAGAFTPICCVCKTRRISAFMCWPATRTFSWMESSIRTTGARTAACCPGGSWARRRGALVLPANARDAHAAQTNVYGYMLGRSALRRDSLRL